MSRGSRVVMAAALAAPIVVLGPVSPAVALNVVAVTTTSDVVNAGDGVVSLREAFTIANTDGDNTQITLVPDALYRLCDVVSTATDEDANLDGDLDHTATHALTIVGNGAEIRSACPGERVMHHVSTDGSIALSDLLVAGGDLGVGQPGSGLLSAGDTSIDDVTFTDNTGGPAVEVGESGLGGVTASVTDSRFTDNRGGIRVNSSTSTISDTDFVGNQGPAVAIDRGSSTITNVLARENMRGITGIDGAISVTGSHVRDNAGYGIRNTGNAPTGYPLTVTDTIVERNRAAGVECSYCTNLTITGSTITDTVPDGFGGSGVSFIQNVPGPSVTITDSVISGNAATEHGGGVLLRVTDDEVGSVTISGTTITGNRTGLFGDGAGIYATSTNLTLTDSHVDDNIAKPNDVLVGGSGGGIAMSDGGSLTVTGSTIDDNFADARGGGVTLLNVPTASFTASSLSGNTADGFGGGGFEAVGTGTSYSFVETTVDGNTSQLAGGGIDVATSGSGVQVLLDRSTVSDNTTVGSNGGGVFTNSPLSALTIRNSTVTGNAASSIGGGVAALQSGTITLDHATIVSNSAPTTANVRTQVGALTSFGSVIALAQGGGNNCDTFSGPTVSQGYNVSGTNTCGFGAGAGDLPAAGNPLLGGLVSVGGPTAVRVPLAGSPLVSAIPPAACALAVDQRNASRPLGAGCEIGSVELVTAGVVPVDDFVSIPSGRLLPTVIHPLRNDYDPGKRLLPISLRIVDRPDHGTAVAIPLGQILYKADKRFSGTDSITYQVCVKPPKRPVGARPDCVTAVVTITVGRR